MRKYFRFTVLPILFYCASIAPGGFIAPALAAGKSGSFTGSWTANGSKEVLPFGANRDTALFKLSGHVNLKNELGMQKDYWSECIGLADSASGSDARCVWRGLNGQEIYIVLQSKRLAKGAIVTGTIVGGSGPVAGIKGSLNFEWSTMSFQRQSNSTAIGGYASGLTGSFQLP